MSDAKKPFRPPADEPFLFWFGIVEVNADTIVIETLSHNPFGEPHESRFELRVGDSMTVSPPEKEGIFMQIG